MYYLADATCDGGFEVHEVFLDATMGWTTGSLDDQHVCASASSNFLYALWYTGNGPTGSLRIGFMAARSNLLSEASFPAWKVSAFL